MSGQPRGWTGPALALTSAALFGASTPFAKLLLDDVGPWLLAGLLYLGSGLGLAVVRVAQRRARALGRLEADLQGPAWWWLGGAVLAGGVVGPVFLMFGLTATPASSASLLLNLEAVFTALLAWFVFKENVDARIALGMLSIVAGVIVLTWEGAAGFRGALGPAAIAGACLAWAIDNNLTRKVALSDPIEIGMVKGLVAGSVNLGLAMLFGATFPSLAVAASSGILGLLGYGVSVVLFIHALRHIGTARTAAYFSTAPFIGAGVAILALGEAADERFLIAGALMGLGVWLHLTERHDHEHVHLPITHTHRHRHDEHHQHEHEASDPPGEPHTHRHRHAALRHSHAHFPDAHHRHEH